MNISEKTVEKHLAAALVHILDALRKAQSEDAAQEAYGVIRHDQRSRDWRSGRHLGGPTGSARVAPGEQADLDAWLASDARHRGRCCAPRPSGTTSIVSRR